MFRPSYGAPMLARIVTAILVVFAAISAAEAQRSAQPAPRPLPPVPRAFPAEKFSTQPVQPQMIEAPARLSPAANPEQWPVVESAWTKFCGKDQNDPHGTLLCLTVKEIRLRSHTERFIAGVAVIESADDDKKFLRVTLPVELQRSAPVRLRVDNDVARNGEFRQCLAHGCIWD